MVSPEGWRAARHAASPDASLSFSPHWTTKSGGPGLPLPPPALQPHGSWLRVTGASRCLCPEVGSGGASVPAGTHRCTRGCSTPDSRPRALGTRSRRGPPPCTAGSSAGCRWSRSPSTGSTSSTPATVRPLAAAGTKEMDTAELPPKPGRASRPLSRFWGGVVLGRNAGSPWPRARPQNHSIPRSGRVPKLPSLQIH